ncbi:MAG: prepilin peptidase, partial [Methylococcales bacterium]
MIEQLNILLNNPVAFAGLIGVVGLLVGSFLNVVIYRMPVMMQRNWRKECLEYLQLPPDLENAEPFNLSVPLS